MFYLKYRPKTIEEIDNQKARERIQTLLKSLNLPHALLLTGPKGTGKTSTARLMAKVINCENNAFAQKNQSIEPCNECALCTNIASGQTTDIIEIDAASNRKIDDVRTLIANVKFVPLYARYKVYIIDEVHMLTMEAFNALLKTLEEPPKSVKFILATTEVEKVPKTITSRCTHIVFNKAKKEEIIRMLKRIAAKENLKIEEEVLQFISRHADNSFRDAAKILEEACLSQGKKSITEEKVKTILGLKDESANFLKLIEEKKLKEIFAFLESYEERGGNFKTLIETTLDEFHLLLKSKVLTNDDLKNSLTLSEISLLVKLLQEAYNNLKISPLEILPLEIAMTEFVINNSKS